MHEGKPISHVGGDRCQKMGHMRDASAPESKMTKGTFEVNVGFIDLLQRGRMHTLGCELSINRVLERFYDKI